MENINKSEKGIFIRLDKDIKDALKEYTESYGGSMTAYARRIIIEDLTKKGRL